MRTLAIIADNPKYAYLIARALSHEGYQYNVHGVAVHEVTKNNVLYKISSLPGHLMRYRYPLKEYKNASFSDLFVSDPIKEIDKRAEGGMLIKAIAPGAEMVIAATENSAEGDSIALEIGKLLSNEKYNIPTRRMRCNTFSFVDIRNALYNIENLDMASAQGYNLLTKLDFMFNTVLTRQMTSYLSPKHFENAGHVPIGSCLTPLLETLLRREKEIEKEKYIETWEVCAKLEAGQNNRVTVCSTENPIHDQNIATSIKERITSKEKLEAVVQYVNESTIEVPVPDPFNFPAIIAECNRLYGYDPSETIEMLDFLYRKGYISYPFVIEKEYPIGFDFKEPFRDWDSEGGSKIRFSVLCKQMLETEIAREGTSARKSTPIYPRRPLTARHVRDKRLLSVFKLIFKHYVAILSSPLVVKKQEIIFSINDEGFSCTNGSVIDEGWAGIYRRALENFFPLLDCKQGDSFEVVDVQTRQVKADVEPISSLDLYTTVYENAGKDVNNVIEEGIRCGLITRSKSYFKLTPHGRNIAEILNEHAPILMHFTFRQQAMKLARDVIGQKLMYDNAYHSGKYDLLMNISKALDYQKEAISQKLEDCFLEQEYQVVGKCPDCGKALVMRTYTHPDRNVKRFVGCYGYPDCTRTYSLPKDGELEIGGICPRASLPFMNVDNKGKKRNYQWGIGAGPCFQCSYEGCKNKAIEKTFAMVEETVV
jgi:DNA topoisomerase-1